MEYYRKLFLSVVGVFVLFGLLAISSVSGQLNRKYVDNLKEPNAAGDDVTFCHVTGSDTNPYEVKTLPKAALQGHLDHGDIYPVPAGGCPAGVVGTPTPVPGATPEPVTVLLFGTGLAAAGYAARRARRKKAEDLDS